MRDEYDFSDAFPNPYAKKLRKTVTINLDAIVIDFFKQEADRTGVPYQRLINLYLLQCVREKKRLEFV